MPKTTTRPTRILRFAEEHYPRDIHVRLGGVERDAEAGRWTGDILLAETADAHMREHLFHLQGLVLLQLNRPEEAREIWSATPTDEHCHIESLRELASALVAGQSETAPPDLDTGPGLTGLVWAAHQADRHVARGDVDGALRVLDRAWIREAREEQTLARLASAHLDHPGPGATTTLPPPRWRCALPGSGPGLSFEPPPRRIHRSAQVLESGL